MKKEISYYIYSPCGNDTALVQGLDFSNKAKKIINDKIMKISPNVEQVGFVETNGEPKLIMAGGEFCGNATRSAAYYYLKGEVGEINIDVLGVNSSIKAGIDSDKNAWSQVPIYSGEDVVTVIEPGIYKVKMEGITHLIVEEKQAKKYLEVKENIKKAAMKLIEKVDIIETEAIGVMFLEKINQKLKIHPVVWVKSIDTLFYETACGSGSVAVAILESLNKNSSLKLEILQPSGQVINAGAMLKNGMPVDAIISGKISCDGVLRKIEVDI